MVRKEILLSPLACSIVSCRKYLLYSVIFIYAPKLCLLKIYRTAIIGGELLTNSVSKRTVKELIKKENRTEELFY